MLAEVVAALIVMAIAELIRWAWGRVVVRWAE